MPRIMNDQPARRQADFHTRLFERQGLHLGLLAVLLAAVGIVVSRFGAAIEGSLWGVSTSAWFWIAVGSAIAHQGYTWLAWRLQLHAGAFTRAFGKAGFRAYRFVFGILGVSRLLIIPLAVANRGSLELPGVLQWGVSGVFLLLSGYLFYSVIRYFGINRAAGLDHFDLEAQHWPLVEKGIFRFTSNGMYAFGFLAVWIPGLALESAAALLAAAFQHAYIWVHYVCTEKPDMERIYGDLPGRRLGMGSRQE